MLRTVLTRAERAGIRARAKVLHDEALRVAEQNDRARNAAEDAGGTYEPKLIKLSTFEAAIIANDLDRLLGETE